MNAQATEGPYEAKYDFASDRHAPSIVIRDLGGYVLAVIPRKGRKWQTARPQEEQEGNAAMFAEAPELLKAAIAYRNHLKTAASTEGQVRTYEHLCEVIGRASCQK